jgi:hypothetical protein
MIYAAVFLLLTGAMATAAAYTVQPQAMTRVVRQTAYTSMAICCVGIALWLVFPHGPWLLPAALSINGSACVAHGISLNFRLRMLTGFLFCVLGGVQLGIVLILAGFSG